MSLSSGTIEQRAERCRRGHTAIRELFLTELRGRLMRYGRFHNPLCSPWARAAGLNHGHRRRCPLDGRTVEPAGITVYWKGFRWTTVVGQWPSCGTVYHTRPEFRADDYLGRETGEGIRREFLRTIGAA
jgi:hypothetical protein